MTFFNWLGKQLKRNDAVGDLARIVKVDKNFPRGTRHRAAREYVGATVALDALLQAQHEYGIEQTGAETRSYPSIFIQAAKHLQRERNGEDPCGCDSCNVIRDVLEGYDYGKPAHAAWIKRNR